MRRPSRKVLAIGIGAALAIAGIAAVPVALAQSTPNDPPPVEGTPRPDEHVSPLEQARRDARTEAIEAVVTGKATPVKDGASTVVDLGPVIDGIPGESAGPSARGGGGGGNFPGHRHTQYVELAREATDQIFVILVEFGDNNGGLTTDPAAQRTAGPLHNQIPQPNRNVDNSTNWRANYNKAHYEDYYFGNGDSLRTYYEGQSSGRYSVAGAVQNWVFVPHTEAYYGTNDENFDAEGESGDARAWLLIRDAADAWYQAQLAAGKTEAQIATYLAQFDVYDRYDFDGDGDFNEPDGYIDHFQIVHAGGDEADGDPIYASDALWSHRWAAFQDGGDGLGPWDDTNSVYGSIGGAQLGESPTWIYDYTLQPENGGRSVFYHEYGHDLGLPDDYNIYSHPGNVDNSNEFWTLMAQSRLSAPGEKSIGDRAGDLSAWNKLQLGWLNYEYLPYTTHKTLKLGPEEYNSNFKQALIVSLPKKEVSTDVGAPFAGAGQYYSGHNDDTTFTLTKSVTVPATGDLTLAFQTRFDIEWGWDYAYVAVNGTPIVGQVAGIDTVLDGSVFGPNYYGATVGWDRTVSGWTTGVFDLTPYAGQTVSLTFAYVTDAAVGGNTSDYPDGVFVDDVTLGGTVIGDAESGLGDWVATPDGGWEAVGATATSYYSHYYIASYRSYTEHDKYLKSGPYNFGFLNTKEDWVEHFPYQEGLLVTYWDTSFADNDTVAHPGGGRNLNVDAHPVPIPASNGPNGYWRPRVQVYDAPFGTQRTDRVTLHLLGQAYTFGGLPGNSTFSDTAQYWYPQVPNSGVKLPGYGVKIRVLNNSGGRLQVKLN